MAKKAAKRAATKKSPTSRVKTTRVWVSRDQNDDPMTQWYDIYKSKPTLDVFGRFYSDKFGLIEGGLCPKWFHRMTGIVLKPGTCRQFDLRIEAVPAK